MGTVDQQLEMNSQAVMETKQCPALSRGVIAQELVSLDPHGDVILEINDNDSQEVLRLLVSTNVLRLSSPVFAGMFGSRFREGQNLHNEERGTVKLMDDNAFAMKTILEILHHPPPADIDPNKNAREIASIAIHCDKYDCRAALRPWTYYWFRDLGTGQRSPTELTLFLVAAYRFDEPRQFSAVSTMAVKYMPLEVLANWDDDERLDHFPEVAAVALNSKIQDRLNYLHGQVQSVITVLAQDKRGHEMTLQNCIHCGRTPPREAKKCHPCNNSMLFPKYCTAISDLVHRIMCANEDIKHTCSAGIRCPLLQQLQILSGVAQQSQKDIQGLCLVCIKTGRWADNNTCICVP